MPPLISTIQQEKARYLLGKGTQRAIASATGVSRYKLQQLTFKGRALTGSDLKAFNNYYRRWNYTDLRTQGFSVTQSRRFQSANVARTASIRLRFQNISEYLSEGAYAAMKKSRDIKGIAYDDDLLMSEAQDAILDGLRKSKKTIEDWENY